MKSDTNIGIAGRWMVLLAIILFSGSFFQAFGHMSQDKPLLSEYLQNEKNLYEIQVSIGLEQASISEAFELLEQQMGQRFLYNKKVIEKSSHLLDLNFPQATVADVLMAVTEQTGLRFRQINRLISVGVSELKEPEIEEETEQQATVTGQVVDAQTGEALPGVNILIQGTSTGTSTDVDGNFQLNLSDLDQVLIITYIGYDRLEISIDGRSELNIELQPSIIAGDELVVVGYGVQRRSDVTGSVASISQDRLQDLPNQNINQAIQGAVPGVMVRTTSAGSASNEEIMIRGRNSILADNSPLIVLDGVQYAGNIRDINPNDVESIEILKDASAAAIYGSRGSNGVILITTKEGIDDTPRLSYNGSISTQNFVNIPNIMNGEEFFEFKMERFPAGMTQTETEVYESGEWVDWLDEGLRQGLAHEHNLSISGGFGNTTYYLGGGFHDVRGLAVNDYYQRLSGRVNIDTQIGDWLTIGTRSQYTDEDRSGSSISVAGIFFLNPLTKVRDEEGNLELSPWPEEAGFFDNPLEPTLYEDTNVADQLVTNNYAIIEFPFIDGLSYRLNTGYRLRRTDQANYRGRNTKSGQDAGGRADLARGSFENIVIENQLNFNRDFRQHNFFVTAVIGYEKENSRVNSLSVRGFPNDFLSFFGSAEANVSTPGFSYNETTLQSQMLRLNYNYDSRYLITLTGRRDGFSGFGSDTKWGLFPSVALAWNFSNEDFFPWSNFINEFKPRLSFGVNGNQAVSPFQSIALLSSKNIVDENSTQAGFIPGNLAQENLGWEESRTINIGLDIGILEDRFSGELNLYRTNTTDLLLNRTIPSVHGFSSIVQNIGETKNTGLDFSLRSRNIHTEDFMWSTTVNFSYVSNEIVDLFGTGQDDPANAWFIGQPINVIYDFVVDGVWQLDEAEEAAEWGSQPGFVKLRDVTGNGQLTGDDRQVIGQQDPKTLWGVTNTFSYRNFNLDVFIHGVHGVTKFNGLKTDDETFSTIRRNTTKKNWWTPDNPTNEFVMNDLEAERMAGIRARWYEDASFIRLKDVSISYQLPLELVQRFNMRNIRVYFSGRNLATNTNFGGVDPELSGTSSTIPLQREFMVGVNLDF